MSAQTIKVLSCLAVAAALGGTIAAFAMGGCSGVIEKAAGGSVPMKCHWTILAVGFIGLITVVTSLGGFFIKDPTGRRWAAGFAIAAAAVALFCLYGPVMGLCGKSTMECHTTATVCTVFLVVMMACDAAVLIKADGEKPKMKL
jgi:hypothetical protein